MSLMSCEMCHMLQTLTWERQIKAKLAGKQGHVQISLKMCVQGYSASRSPGFEDENYCGSSPGWWLLWWRTTALVGGRNLNMHQNITNDWMNSAVDKCDMRW